MKIKKWSVVLLCVSALLSNIAVNARGMGVASWINRYSALTDTVTDSQNKLWVRDIEEWSDFETDGNGIIIPERVKERYRKLKEENKEIVMVLAYGNVLYGDTNITMPTVDNKEYFEKWLNYVRTMVTEFKEEVNYFEIWNEPNLAVSNSNATAKEYAEMAVATRNAIKKIKADAVVIGGAIAYANPHKQFTRDFYNNGGNEMDGLSFHIYEYDSYPETLWLNRVNNLGSFLAELKYDKPIWLTETGYSTNTSGVSEKTQAEYLIRMHVLWDNFLKTNNKEGKMFWFFANDWGTDKSAVSPNHGLVRTNGTLKDSFYSFTALNSLTENKDFIQLDSGGGIYKALYQNSRTNDKLYILWNLNDGESEQTLTVDSDAVNIYNYKGEKISNVPVQDNSVKIKVKSDPILIECKNHGTNISAVHYSEQKRLLTIKGECDFKDTVKIEIEKNGTVIETVYANAAGGKFEKDIYTAAAGICKIYAGRDERYHYDSAEIDFGQSEEFTVENVMLVADNANVSVSGTAAGAKDGQILSVMILPEAVELKTAIAANLAYVGETTVNQEKFNLNCAMPEKSEGKYKLYIGGKNISGIFSKDFNNGANSRFVGVCDLSAKKQSSVSVYAKLNNTDTVQRKANIVVAQYNDRALCNVKCENVTVDANTVLGKTYEFTVPLDSGATEVKVFAFDSANNLIPLSEWVYAQ